MQTGASVLQTYIDMSAIWANCWPLNDSKITHMSFKSHPLNNCFKLHSCSMSHNVNYIELGISWSSNLSFTNYHQVLVGIAFSTSTTTMKSFSKHRITDFNPIYSWNI